MKAILFKDGVEFKRANYPKKNWSAFAQGDLEAGLEWKIVVEDVRPVVDTRLYTLLPVETNTEINHSTHTHLKEFRVTWNTVLKNKTQIIEEVKKIYDEKNKSIIGELDKDSIFLVGIASLIKEVRGGTPSTLENKVRDMFISKGINIVNNHLNKIDLINKINTDQVYDIDAGWFDVE